MAKEVQVPKTLNVKDAEGNDYCEVDLDPRVRSALACAMKENGWTLQEAFSNAMNVGLSKIL